MKRLALPFVLAFSPFAVAGTTIGAEIPKVDALYVPQGYDDNDIVEVVISGTFGDSCHQVGEPIVKIDEKKKTVTLTPISYKEPGRMCIQMLSPYTHVVRIGHLNAGNYTFRLTNDVKAMKSLDVKHALVDATDDFLYPPVDFAEVAHDQAGFPVLKVKGRYPLMKKGCMKTQSVDFDFQNGDTLVVQPKAIVTEDVPGGCESHYEETYQLPRDLVGTFLIHVRALNGQSYNRVETL